MYPFYCVDVNFIHQYCIEATKLFAMTLQVTLGSAPYLLLLGRCDAHGSAPKAMAAAQAYFNKHGCRAILHNEVNLAVTAAKVSRDKL